jgi:hypothetical protein
MQPTGTPAAGAVLRSDTMLGKLLVLNDEMIAQLRLERHSAVGTTDFLTGMINQHEKIAARLTAQLKKHEAEASRVKGPAQDASLGNPLTC